MANKKTREEKIQERNQKNALGLTYDEQKKIGRRAHEMSDITWAGRLYSKYPYWNKKLTSVVFVALLISVLSLLTMWISVIARKPALLIGVYPDAEMLCFPRLRTVSGAESLTHNSYKDKCDELQRRAGRKWQAANAQLDASDPASIGDITRKIEYKDIEYSFNNSMLMKERERQAAAARANIPAYQQSALPPSQPPVVPGVTPSAVP